MSISFDLGDRLTLHNALPEIATALVGTFSQMIQKHGWTKALFEIKFRGYPWNTMGDESVTSRLMLIQLLNCLELFGYTLYASMKQQSGPSDNNSISAAADVLVFNREIDWTSGSPIRLR